MKKKKIIVSVTNDLYTDQRVDKVCSFLHENHFDVVLVGRIRKKSLKLKSRKYQIHRFRLIFDKGALFYAEYNFRLFFYLLFHKSDYLLANDLDTLLANYLAYKLKRKNELFYDAHEYFTEVPEIQGRFAKKVWLWIEEWIFPNLKHIYTVNLSIADLYQKKYHKKVLVVRNISPLWKPENILSKKELSLPEDKPILIYQGAGINMDRGAEEAVEAMKEISNAYLVFVGDGDVVSQLKKQVEINNLSSRVLFYGKQNYQQLLHFTHHSTIGLTLDKDSNINYRFSLPNKLFDYIHTNTVVVCTPIIEVKQIVEQYRVGVVLSKLSPKELAKTINHLLENPEQLNHYKNNCNQAKQLLNWENECQQLKQIYFLNHD